MLPRFILIWQCKGDMWAHEEEYQDRYTCEDRIRALRKDYGKIIYKIEDRNPCPFYVHARGF